MQEICHPTALRSMDWSTWSTQYKQNTTELYIYINTCVCIHLFVFLVDKLVIALKKLFMYVGMN